MPFAMMAQGRAGWGLHQLAWSAGVALLSQLIPQTRRGRPFVTLVTYLVVFTILGSVHM